jgi:hypothetical protein
MISIGRKHIRQPSTTHMRIPIPKTTIIRFEIEL